MALAILVAGASAFLTFQFWSQPHPTPSDFSQVWAGARALSHGGDPYQAVGPGREFEWPFRLLYPLTAVLVAWPLSWLPLRWADPIFVGLASAFLSWALTRQRLDNPQLLVFVSLPFWYVLQTSQWSPALTAAALVPAAGFLFACKPTIGLALFAAFPSRIAAISAAAWLVFSIVLSPHWVGEWRSLLPTATHVLAPVSITGGILVLAVLIKWRQPEARLLAAMALVPHTVSFYELVPLFLIPKTWSEGWALSLLSALAYVLHRVTADYSSYDAFIAGGAKWIVWIVYLPCAARILLRSDASIDSRYRNRKTVTV